MSDDSFEYTSLFNGNFVKKINRYTKKKMHNCLKFIPSLIRINPGFDSLILVK